MSEERRRQLVENYTYIFRGEKVKAAGWKNPAEATIAPRSGGFYRVTWETLERCAMLNHEIPVNRVWQSSRAWLGIGKEPEGERMAGESYRQ